MDEVSTKYFSQRNPNFLDKFITNEQQKPKILQNNEIPHTDKVKVKPKINAGTKDTRIKSYEPLKPKKMEISIIKEEKMKFQVPKKKLTQEEINRANVNNVKNSPDKKTKMPNYLRNVKKNVKKEISSNEKEK